MPRQARIVVPGVPHHVYLRGNNRRRLFSNDGDRLFWLQCVEKAIEATGVKVHQHTLMTNHVHFVITPPTKRALSEFVKRACQRYSQARNKKMNASGKLFEQRYHSKVITDEKYLFFALLYNDANAFRAGLVDDPTEHRWSTGPLHAGRPGSRFPVSMWTPLPFYLRLGATIAERGAAYQRLMATYLHDESWIPVDDGSNDPRYRQRVERPDGTSAREPVTQWARKAE